MLLKAFVCMYAILNLFFINTASNLPSNRACSGGCRNGVAMISAENPLKICARCIQLMGGRYLLSNGAREGIPVGGRYLLSSGAREGIQVANC